MGGVVVGDGVIAVGEHGEGIRSVDGAGEEGRRHRAAQHRPVLRKGERFDLRVFPVAILPVGSLGRRVRHSLLESRGEGAAEEAGATHVVLGEHLQPRAQRHFQICHDLQRPIQEGLLALAPCCSYREAYAALRGLGGKFATIMVGALEQGAIPAIDTLGRRVRLRHRVARLDRHHRTPLVKVGAARLSADARRLRGHRLRACRQMWAGGARRVRMVR
mmetsp:Transcript_4968/g.13151  ORF Transcript_4968/g.13151 Transcript_4968/m.13151 type:complete len:218 (-) Transcript_4968:471-1124(-)